MTILKNAYSIPIQTKYLGATNYRGERVKAFTLDNHPNTGKPETVTVGYDYGLDARGNHDEAMQKLHDAIYHKLDWEGTTYKTTCEHITHVTYTHRGYIYSTTSISDYLTESDELFTAKYKNKKRNKLEKKSLLKRFWGK